MDYNFYLSTLKNIEEKNIILLGIVILFTIIISVCYRFFKNNFWEYTFKIGIVCFVLCFVFLIPQTIGLIRDVSQESIVCEESVKYKINNSNSTVNGFDYFNDYNIVELNNGKKLLIITSEQKLPNGEGTADIVYAKHSRVLLEYNTDNT